MLKLIKYDFEMVNTKIFSIFYKNAISEGNLFIYLKKIKREKKKDSEKWKWPIDDVDNWALTLLYLCLYSRCQLLMMDLASATQHPHVMFPFLKYIFFAFYSLRCSDLMPVYLKFDAKHSLDIWRLFSNDVLVILFVFFENICGWKNIWKYA